MKYRVFRVLIVSLVCLTLCSSLPLSAAKPLVLFDEGHAQRAGNADWVIDGGFSDFADVFKSLGCEVKAVTRLTADALNGAAVVVLPEPNSVYSAEEEAAIVNFVNHGGGLYAIGDHDQSDRNGDGIDSVGVLNRFLPKLGLQLEKRYFTEAPVAGVYKDTPLTKGVKAVGTWGGTSVKCLGSRAMAHICVSDKNGGDAFIATNEVGNGGRVVAMGDSSPYDDGTGDPRDKLHNGFSNPKYHHDILAKNSVAWLLAGVRAAPRARVHAMISELREAQTALSREASEAMLDYTANTERNLVQTLLDHPELISEVKPALSENGLQGVMRSIETVQSFKAIHGN